MCEEYGAELTFRVGAKMTEKQEIQYKIYDEIIVKLKNLTNGNSKEVRLPDSHATIVSAVTVFAQLEQIPMSKIDIQVSKRYDQLIST